MHSGTSSGTRVSRNHLEHTYKSNETSKRENKQDRANIEGNIIKEKLHPKTAPEPSRTYELCQFRDLQSSSPLSTPSKNDQTVQTESPKRMVPDKQTSRSRTRVVVRRHSFCHTSTQVPDNTLSDNRRSRHRLGRSAERYSYESAVAGDPETMALEQKRNANRLQSNKVKIAPTAE